MRLGNFLRFLIFLESREYHGLNKDGEEVEMQHALTTKIGDGQVLDIICSKLAKKSSSSLNSQYGLPWERDFWGCVLVRRGGF